MSDKCDACTAEHIAMLNAQDTRIGELHAVIKTLKTERHILAMLSADKPQFFNPMGIFEAKALRDRILKPRENKT